MPELVTFRLYVSALVAQLRAMREDERGSITLEQILITTTLVAAALATGAVILSRVSDAARAIPTGQ
jgi:hypothetical protein